MNKKTKTDCHQLGNSYYGISYCKFTDYTDIGINIYPFSFAVCINFLRKPFLGFTFSCFFLNINIDFSISDLANRE